MSAASADLELNITPHYGWGWLERPTDKPVAVPPPFAFRASISRPGGRFVATGVVDLPGHPLHGLWPRLEQRHREWDGLCNLSAYRRPPFVESPPREDEAYRGFAGVDPVRRLLA